MQLMATLPPLNDMAALRVFECEMCRLRDSIPILEEGKAQTFDVKLSSAHLRESSHLRPAQFTARTPAAIRSQ
jgi:hypothetical protein